MVTLWIYLTLGSDRYEFTILLKKKNSYRGRKPESYNRDVKSFSVGMHRIFIKSTASKRNGNLIHCELVFLVQDRSSELTGRVSCGM